MNDTPVQTKTCTNCRRAKCLLDFYKNAAYKDGYTSHCKECRRAYEKKHRKEHPRNPQKVSAYHRTYYRENKEAILKKRKDWYKQKQERLQSAKENTER